ncbi:MAG TPA: thiamine phosphate synthase [Terriglobia bacterium]|nr:thiamine phosphate synthase [Terriglobia bacterium]
MDLWLPRFYAIVDVTQLASRSPAEATDSLLAAGVRLIQYRDKKANARELYAGALTLAERIQRAGGTLIVNDRADVALAVGADGAHLGQEDFPATSARSILPKGAIIGLSTHSVAQVEAADREPVDYIAFGPIFATSSKENPDPVVGLPGLAEARKVTQKPLVAIGGITLQNARSVIDAGANSVAVIGALLSAPDVGEQARKFLAILGG